MIPLMSINSLLLFDNLNSATPVRLKHGIKRKSPYYIPDAWTAQKRREIMQGPWYLPFSFPTTLFSISFIYLFRLPVLSEMGVNFRDRPRVYFTLMEENIQKLYM